MRKALLWLAEPVAVLGIVLVLAWAAHTVVTPVRVGGSSMSPALRPGDVVFVRLGSRPVVGDIVLISVSGHAPLLHRVVSLLDGGALRTKGDANAVDDLETARPAEVVGRSVAVLPIGSWLARWKGQSACATMSSQPNTARQ